MVSRLVAAFVAVLFAANPTVRAICDVSCLRPGEMSHAASVSDHCSSPETTVPASPGGCDHEHQASGSLHTASKTSIPAPDVAALPAGDSQVAVVSIARLAIAASLPPDPPVPTRPRPLRI